MNKKHLKIAKEALYQYELMRIKRIESMSEVEFQPTEEYENKKRELRAQIKSNSLKPKGLSNKQKLSLLVAAAIILTLVATACAFGKQIKGFFVNLFDTTASFENTEDSSNTYIEYKLTYIPDNYIEIGTYTYNNTIKTLYSDNKNAISFIRLPETQFYTLVDIQRTEFEIFNLENKEIYYKKKNDLYSFYWVTEDATLYLNCNESIQWSDIERMIMSVECNDSK